MDNALLYHALRLMSLSVLHRQMSVQDVMDWLIPPMTLRQYAFMVDEGQFVAFATWAFLSNEAHTAMRGSSRPLTLHEWDSGPYLWVVDFIAPFGHTRKFARNLKTLAGEKGFDGQKVHFTRRYAHAKGEAWRYHS